MKPSKIALAFGLAVFLGAEAQPQTITDTFADASQWGPPFAESGKNFAVANGRMNFTSATTAGGGGGLVRNTPFLTTTQNWSIKVDVHIDPFVITNEYHGVSVFLGVGKTSDWLGTHVILGFDRDWWYPSFYGVNDDVQVNGVSVPGFTNMNYLPSPDATLRLDYNAANQSITYACESDGSAGGGGWITLGTTNIAGDTYDLHLLPADTLSVLVAGWSNGHVVTNGQAYFDNLQITVIDTGSLQVTIWPANAVSAGAQWQVDGGAWQNHSNVVSDLSVGSHTVSYKTIPGWNTPSNQTVVVSAGATSLTNGTYAQQDGSLAEGLVAFYPLDGSANDTTTNGNHGTVYGATPITNRFGVQNSAYYFNGTGNYIRIPQSFALSNLSTATISYWVKYYRTGVGDYQVSMTICNGQDRYSPPGLWTYATADRLMHFLGRQGGVSEHADIPMAATTPLTQQPFVFVTFVVEATNLFSYKNGVRQGTAARQGLPIARPNYDWFIGTSGDFGLFPYYLNGMMDDVRIYNRALSDIEVWQLYLAEAGITNTAPLIITTNASFGISNGLFGFNLSGSAGQAVVTEAATNLANPFWVPLKTNNLTGDGIYFSDPQWTNFPGRFYRLRAQ